MNITEKKRIFTVSLCLLFCLVGILLGNSVTPTGKGAVILSPTTTETSLFAKLISEIYPSFKTQIIQFAIIFIFAFTPYLHIANSFVFFTRGFAIGYGVNIITLGNTADMSALCFCISYLIITAVMVVCISHLFQIKTEGFENKGFTVKVRSAANALLLYLMTTGVAVLIRILPIFIVYSAK